MKIYQSPSPTGGVLLMATRPVWQRLSDRYPGGMLNVPPEAKLIRAALANDPGEIIRIPCTEEEARLILAVT